MKKIIITITILSLCLFSFAGCSDKVENDETNSKIESSQSIQDPQSQEEAPVDTEQVAKITKITLQPTSTVQIKTGETYELLISVESDSEEFPLDDIMLISDDWTVALFGSRDELSSTTIFSEVLGLNEGKTKVYVESKDGTVKSDEVEVEVTFE